MRQENREERFPFFYRKLQTAKNTKRKVNEKGRKDALEQKKDTKKRINSKKMGNRKKKLGTKKAHLHKF